MIDHGKRQAELQCKSEIRKLRKRIDELETEVEELKRERDEAVDAAIENSEDR